MILQLHDVYDPNKNTTGAKSLFHCLNSKLLGVRACFWVLLRRALGLHLLDPDRGCNNQHHDREGTNRNFPLLMLVARHHHQRTLCTATSPPLEPLEDRKIIKVTSDDDVPPTPKEENSSKFVKWVEDFNKKFGYIEKFNKIIKSFEVYPLLRNLGIWIISLILGSFEKNKQHYGKLKIVAAKNRAYIGAIVVLAVAASIWIKKMQSKSPLEQDHPEASSNPE
ncbi:hypothetical protein POM88_051638 [Heracleum sosnowskyi]|uniref:Uncharacterized protein n=1 Tax=Heracleum sosnowskyi TaxID=360622 RepID=A0AAD8M3N8_9APIA|nr:hypothetical protein POM88_051638 [Heracleum sosnowskyi]